MSEIVADGVFNGIGNNLVVKHNHLFQAGFSQLTLNEKKLVCAFLSKVNSMKPTESKVAYTLTVDEVSEIFDIDFTNRGNIHFYKRLAAGLRKKGGRIAKDDGSWLEFSVSQGAEYNKQKKTFTLYFSDFMIPYISSLTENFSQYKFLHIAKMKQSKSIDIYENLVYWISSVKNNTEERAKILTIEELRHNLGIPETKYKEYGSLKRHVLAPAIEEINTITDFNLDFEELKRHHDPKKAKTVTHIKLIFSKKSEWIKAEQKYKKSKKMTDNVINGLIVNGGFIDEYFNKGEFEGLSVSAFMEEAKIKLKSKNPDKYFPDYRKYL